MNTKLTLTLEQNVIEKAKEYARMKHSSLSNLVENYLKTLTAESTRLDEEFSSTVTALKGTFKMPDGFDYKKELTERLSEKHLE
jgi:hypothetical protein